MADIDDRPRPMRDSVKSALHHSMLSTLSKCGLQVYYRWVEGIKVPPGFALHVGSAVHRAAELDLVRKMTTGSPAPREEVVTKARESLALAVEGDGVMLEPEEKSVGLPKLIADAQDKAGDLARLHNAELTPALNPLHVERKMRLELTGYPFDLEGTVDVQEAGRIWDLKTASRAPAADAADGNPQLDTYAMLLSFHDPAPLATVGLNTLVKSEKGAPKLVRVSSPAPTQFGHVLRRVEAAAQVLQTGAFYPADPTGPSGWVCTPKFCGYYDRCPFGAARRVSVPVKETPNAK